MNTAKRTLLSAAIAAALICCCSIQAKAMEGGFEGPTSTTNVLRTEAVDMFLMPTNDTLNTWHRVVRAGSDGTFIASVMDAQGNLLMEGSYSDAECSVQDGRFTFYHGNGQVSDWGFYTMGVKTGTWLHFDTRKSALAAKTR